MHKWMDKEGLGEHFNVCGSFHNSQTAESKTCEPSQML